MLRSDPRASKILYNTPFGAAEASKSLNQTQRSKKTFEEAAVAHKGKILFSYSGVTDGIQERLAEFVGVTAKDLPTLRAMKPDGMKKYASPTAPADLTVESIG